MEVSLYIIASKACEPTQLANLLRAGRQQGPGGGHIDRNGYRVSVLVAPDISDATARSTNCERFVQDVEQAVQRNQTLVFVLAFKCGVRLTQDDWAMIHFTQNVLGKRLLADHTFPVFSSFHRVHGLDDGDAEHVADLEQACQGRLVVLQSADRAELELGQQVDNFLYSVEQHVTRQHYRPYSMEEFLQAHPARQIEMVRTRRDTIEQKVKMECEKIFKHFDCSQRRLEPQHQKACLGDLLNRAKDLSLQVAMDDQDTEVLKDLKDKTDWMCRSVKNALHVCSNQASSDGRIESLENTVARLQHRQHVLVHRQHVLVLCIFLLLTLLLVCVTDRLPSLDLCTWTVLLAWVSGLLVCWWKKVPWRVCCVMFALTIVVWCSSCCFLESKQ